MTDHQPDIDIEAERKDFETFNNGDGGLGLPLSLSQQKGRTYAIWHTEMAFLAFCRRARLAAERERELCDMLADAQHAVCCYSCPEPREGEPDRHCEACVRIGEALTRKGPTDER